MAASPRQRPISASETVPLDRQAGHGRRRFPFGRPPLRPDERPDVGRAAPRLEGRAGDRGQSAALRQGLSRCSMSPAAPATSPSAWSRPAAPAPASRSATSTPTCSPSAASAPRERGLDDASAFEQGNAEELPYPDRSLRLRHHRLRHPQRAAHRARARRSVSRAQDRRPLSLPGIFRGRRARARQALRSLFLPGHPAHRRRR